MRRAPMIERTSKEYESPEVEPFPLFRLVMSIIVCVVGILLITLSNSAGAQPIASKWQEAAWNLLFKGL